jgi:hypothetical protein
LTPKRRIEMAERFVQQQNGGLGHQRPGQRHALLLTGRQLGGVSAQGFPQTTSVDPSSTRRRPGRGIKGATKPEGQLDVLFDGQVG